MIKLFLNDFNKAKKSANPNVATLLYSGFIQQKTNETFFCYAKGISFAGAIQVDLIDSCGVVVQNIDGNFYYSEVNTDIYFEFGNIGTDFYTKELYIKITDLINDNVYYSNSFIVTDYYSELSSRFDFKNKSDVYFQSIRIAKCYHQDIEDKNEFSEYTETSGKLVRYKNTTTNLDRYNIDAVDFALGRWLNELFNYDLIYLNSERVIVSEYKQGKRKGDTNFLDSDFLVNPQGQFYNWVYQLYEGLEIIQTLEFSNGAIFTLPSTETNNYLRLFFNKNITSFMGNAYIKKHSNATALPIDFVDLSDNVLIFNDINVGGQLEALPDANGEWSVIIEGQAKSGSDVWNGFGFGEWTFTIADGEFDGAEFDSTEFLTT
jgi:hypothetical protein